MRCHIVDILFSLSFLFRFDGLEIYAGEIRTTKDTFGVEKADKASRSKQLRHHQLQ